MKALIAGSFDPITVAHEDLIIRAAAIFDEVIVCAFDNSAKRYIYTQRERFDHLKAVAEQYENVFADTSVMMVTEYAEENGIDVIVKGARTATDFEDEFRQFCINRELLPGIETVILPSRPELSFISSTMVRELMKYEKDYKPYVPAAVRDLL